MTLQSQDGAIERTQTLTLRPQFAQIHADLPASDDPAEETSGEHQTLYLAFEVPADALSGPETDSVQSTPLEFDRQTAAAKAAQAHSAPVSTDPAELVQIQALELATNHAEIARQRRENDELRRAMRLRDGWLQDLRSELKAAQEERRIAASQLSETRTSLEQFSNRITQQQAQIISLEAALAERMSMTAFATEGPQTRPATSADMLDLAKPAKLEPLDDDAAPIVLNRKVMTVGRTRENDICVPSVLVSRDHARMLVTENSVTMFDVGSINGCFVNDQVVKRQVLRDGDVLRFADRRYRYCA